MSKRFSRNKSRLLAATLVPTTLLMNLSSIASTSMFAEEEAPSSQTTNTPVQPDTNPDPVNPTPDPEPTPEPDPVEPSSEESKSESPDASTEESEPSDPSDTSSSVSSSTSPDESSSNSSSNDSNSSSTPSEPSSSTSESTEESKEPEIPAADGKIGIKIAPDQKGIVKSITPKGENYEILFDEFNINPGQKRQVIVEFSYDAKDLDGGTANIAVTPKDDTPAARNVTTNTATLLAGEYEVKVTGQKDGAPFEKAILVNVKNPALDAKANTVKAVENLVYTGDEQELFQVTSGDQVTVTYVDPATGEEVPLDETNTPKMTNAGNQSYTFSFKKEGYETLICTATAKIAKMTVNFQMKALDGVPSTIAVLDEGQVIGLDPSAALEAPVNVLQFSVTDKAGNALPAVGFSITSNNTDLLTANGGVVTLQPANLAAAEVKLTPVLADTNNYTTEGAEKTISIVAAKRLRIQQDFVAVDGAYQFDPTKVVLNPQLPFEYKVDTFVDGKAIDMTSIFDVKLTGAGLGMSVKDSAAFVSKLIASENHTLSYRVTATPTVDGKKFDNLSTWISGSLRMSRMDRNDFNLVGSKPSNSDWYGGTEVTLTSPRKIAGNSGQKIHFFYDNQYMDEVKMTEQGELTKAIYGKNDAGVLYYRNIDYKADFTAPDAEFKSIEKLEDINGDTYSTSSTLSVSLNVNDPRIEGINKVSGVRSVDYAFELDENTAQSNWINVPHGKITKTPLKDKEGQNWTFDIEVPDKTATVFVRVTDAAGNSTVVSFMDDQGALKTITVDTTSPLGWIGHTTLASGATWQEKDGEIFTNADTFDFVFAVKEENFEKANAPEAKVFTINKEGEALKETAGNFTKDESNGLYTAVVHADPNAAYVARMSFADVVKHDLEQGAEGGIENSISASSKKGEIETPVIHVHDADITVTVAPVESEPNALKLTLTGHWYDAKDTTIEVRSLTDANEKELKDEQGKDLKLSAEADINKILADPANWSVEGSGYDERTASIVLFTGKDGLPDGRYKFRIHNVDYAGTTYETDKNKPFEHTVDYSTPLITSVKVSMGYDYSGKRASNGATMAMRYNDMVEYFNSDRGDFAQVKVTARSRVAGLSEIMIRLDGEDYAPKDSYLSETYTDQAYEHTAEFTLPRSTAVQIKDKQLNHKILAACIDNRGNMSEWVASDKTVVNDTITPKLKVSYDQSSFLTHNFEETKTDGVLNQYYKSNDFHVGLSINEANFFREDVHVFVSKNGTSRELTSEQVNWQPTATPDVYTADIQPALLWDGADGEYQVIVEYIDRSQNLMGGDASAGTYYSPILVVDTQAPELRRSYYDANPVVRTMKDIHGNDREYLNGNRNGYITILDDNLVFGEGEVKQGLTTEIITEDVSGKEIKGDFYSEQPWKNMNNGSFTKTYVFKGDANYSFKTEYSDLAGNKAVLDYDYFTVDKSAPTNLNISYSKSVLDTVLEGVSFGFYQAPVTATVSAQDNISGIHGFDYSYLKAQGVSSVNASLANQSINFQSLKLTEDLKGGTATFTIPKGMLTSTTQFNGTVDFDATNRAEVTSRRYADTKRIVVDNIAPTCNVEFTAPVNSDGQNQYYASAPTVTVTIHEANFYPGDVHFNMTCNGAPFGVSPVWSHNGDTHTATYTFSGEGRYEGTITYADKSGNAMGTYSFSPFVVDMTKPEISVNVNGKTGDDILAFTDKDLIPHIEVKDDYLDESSVQGEYTKYVWDKKNVVSTSPEIDRAKTNDTTFSYSLSKIGETRDDDGIYKLVGSAKDKSGNSNEASMVFVVNRFGSVYVVGEDLANVVGQYNKFINKELTVYEFNPVTSTKTDIHVTQVHMTRDGDNVALKTKEDLKKENSTATPTLKVDESARIDDDKVDHINNKDRAYWNGYKYGIQPEVFATNGVVPSSAETVKDGDMLDGVYRITVDTTDPSKVNSSYTTYADDIRQGAPAVENVSADNDDTNKTTQLATKQTKGELVSPETLKSVPKVLEFRVDSTAPVISKVQGMENNSYNEKEHVITLSVEDAIALDSIEVLIDGKADPNNTFHDISKDGNVTNKELTVVLKENKDAQKVQVIAKDRAGNIVDTATYGEKEELGTFFNKEILVNTNAFIRWYNNKPLFFSSIAALLAVIFGGIYFFYKKKFKDTEEEEKTIDKK